MISTVLDPQPLAELLTRYGYSESNRQQRELHAMVPGGAHTYARGSDQYPDDMAPILTDGSGALVHDVDGNGYVEFGMGLRSVTLGHAFAPVTAAVTAAIARGTNFTRPTELEALAARDFLDLVPAADMVKFAKNGSDVTTAALRLARAATGRRLVAVADQPFFSVDDWFIGSTEMNAGIPGSVTELTKRFGHNDLDSLRRLFEQHPDQIAAVFLEAATATGEPAPGFLDGVRALCDAHGTVLIFDEMITGFRWAAGGAQSVYGVTPDLSCWGKAMGNGFPIAALAGRRELMELGGLRTDADRVFLLSTTHGPESTGLARLPGRRRRLPGRRSGGRHGAGRLDPVRRGRGVGRRGRTVRPRRHPGPAVLPGLHHPRRRRRTVAGFPGAVPAGVARPRGTGAVVRDLGRAHRRPTRAHPVGGPAGAAGVPGRDRTGQHRWVAAGPASRPGPAPPGRPAPRGLTAARVPGASPVTMIVGRDG